MIANPEPSRGFDHVEAWVFDLDNTLYPADCNLFAQIDTRMGDFIADRFGVSHEEAQRMRKTYYYQYGTTLAGLDSAARCVPVRVPRLCARHRLERHSAGA